MCILVTSFSKYLTCGNLNKTRWKAMGYEYIFKNLENREIIIK